MTGSRRWVRIARWIGIGALVWLAAVNVVINSRLVPRALSDDERVVEWDFAWSILPNRVHVSGFHIEDRTRNLFWQLDVDEASMWLDLGALFGKGFHMTSLSARGADFVVAPREHPLDERRPRRDKERWQVWLEWVDLEDVRSICVMGTCVRGDARVRGGFRIEPLKWFEIDRAALYADGERIEIDGATVAGQVEGVVRARMSRVDVDEVEGLRHFRHTDADTDLQAEIPSVELLAESIGASEPSGGSATLRLRLQLREGRLTEETRVEATARDLAFTLDEHAATIGGPIRGRVRDDVLRVVLDPGQLRARTRDADESQLRSDGLRIVWEGLGGDLAAPTFDSTVRFRVREGEVDAPIAAPFLPDVLAPHAGRGSISAQGSWVGAEGSYDVRVRSAMRGVAVRVEPAVLHARAEVDARLRKRGWRLDARGTRIELTDLEVRHSEEDVSGWWGRLEIGSKLARREDERIANEVRMRMRDARPILALLEAAEDPPDVAQRLIEMNDGLSGTAHAHLGGGGVAFREIDVRGDDLQIEGWLVIRHRRARYSLHFDAGVLSLGIVRDGSGVSFHPFGVGM